MKVSASLATVLAVGLLGSGGAAAFVRETTGPSSGTPLAWDTGCVIMAVAQPPAGAVAWDDLVSAALAASKSWSAASAACGGGFTFEVDKATTGGVAVAQDGVNAIVFRTQNYCGSQSGSPVCDPLSLAITWLYYVNKPGASDDGRLYEADVEINGEAYTWGLEGDSQGGVMDLQSALTHELGHVIGLDHVCYASGMGLPRPVDDQGAPIPDCGASAPTAVMASVMYPASSYTIDRRVLAADDQTGVCAIYPMVSTSRCEGALAPTSSGCNVQGGGSGHPLELLSTLSLIGVFRGRARRRATPAGGNLREG